MGRAVAVVVVALAVSGRAAVPWAKKKAAPAPLSYWDQLKAASEARAYGRAAKLLPNVYAEWWRALLRESPEHVAVETVLVTFLVFVLLYGQRNQKKVVAEAEKLSAREMDELIATWTPEPLVPAPSRAVEILARNERVIEGYTADGLVKLAPARSSSLVGAVSDYMSTAALVNFASFDFLGLGGSAELRGASEKALRHYGCGSCGPRGFYGSMDVHLALEERIALFCGADAAIAFSDSASCATSTVAAFAKRGDLLIVDDAISEPLRTGCVLSRANVLPFCHNDVADLERVLAIVARDDANKGRAPTSQRRFIITEAVSRDVGDVCPLARVVELKERFGYRLILDESLSFGVLGPTGRGLQELAFFKDDDDHHRGPAAASPRGGSASWAENNNKQQQPKVEITCIDLAPALGSVGGLCVGANEVIEHQRLSGAGYCFSAAAPPFVSAAAIASLAILDAPEGLARLRALAENATRLRAKLEGALQANPASSKLRLLATPSNKDASKEEQDAPVPFTHVALADAPADVADELDQLEAIVATVARSGYALTVTKHGHSFFPDAATQLPNMQRTPLTIRVATKARHTAADIDALVAALAAAAK